MERLKAKAISSVYQVTGVSGMFLLIRDRFTLSFLPMPMQFGQIDVCQNVLCPLSLLIL